MATDIEKAREITADIMKICEDYAIGMEELVKNWDEPAKSVGLEIANMQKCIRGYLTIAYTYLLIEKEKK